MIRPILIYPDEVLRMKSNPIKLFNNDLAMLCKDMSDTMENKNGIGLAAVQIGYPRCVILVRTGYNSHIHMINPQILEISVDEVTLEEGCLSFPGVFDRISRPEHVWVEFNDPSGFARSEKFTGWPSRIIQHEMEHLDGMLMVDHMTPTARKQIEKRAKKGKKL